MKQEPLIAVKLAGIFTLLLGALYPLFILLLAQTTMPINANGSLIYKENTLVGSLLIGQEFTSDKYFWGRPSATQYSTTPSGGSNLSLTSPILHNQIKQRKAALLKSVTDKNITHVPSDLLFASGSGVDPHISREAAYFQSKRIAKARPNLTENDVIELIDSLVEHPHSKILTHPYVNVLKLNIALDLKSDK